MTPPDAKVTADARELAERICALAEVVRRNGGEWIALDVAKVAAVLAPVVQERDEAQQLLNERARDTEDWATVMTDVHQYFAEEKADRSRGRGTLLLTLLGNLRNERDELRAEIVRLEKNLYTGDDDEKRALRAEMDRLKQVQADFTAWQTSVIATIGGTVEGKATTTGNYLQRLRDLVAVEAEKREWILGTAKLACKNTLLEQEVAALRAEVERLKTCPTCQSSGDGMPCAYPTETAKALRADIDRLNAEVAVLEGQLAASEKNTERKMALIKIREDQLDAARREGGGHD